MNIRTFLHSTANRLFAFAAALTLGLALPAGDAAAQPCDNLVMPNFGTNGIVRDAVEFQGQLIIGGDFTTAGNQPANRLARWTGTSWVEFAGGTNGAVHGLAIHNGDLFVSGFFTSAGGVACHNVARWDGKQWHPFGAANNPVAIVRSHGDSLVGFIRYSNLVRRWDGETWAVIGDAQPGGNNFLFRVIVFEGDVYAAGFFNTMNGVPAISIARWDGTDWHPVGAGLSVGVWSLAVHDGVLYAGGIFNQSGGLPITRVARWDGMQWNSMGSGPPMANPTALGSYAGHLIAAGTTSVNGLIGRWNGIAWEQLGGTFSSSNPDHALTVAEADGILVVGGIHASENYVLFWQNCASACCVNGECVPLTEEQCAAVGGTFFGTGFGCGDVVCEPVETACPGDLNNSGAVDVQDLLILLGNWGVCP